MIEQTVTIHENLTSRKADTIRRELSQANPSRYFEVQRGDGKNYLVVEIVRVPR